MIKVAEWLDISAPSAERGLGFPEPGKRIPSRMRLFNPFTIHEQVEVNSEPLVMKGAGGMAPRRPSVSECETES